MDGSERDREGNGHKKHYLTGKLRRMGAEATLASGEGVGSKEYEKKRGGCGWKKKGLP